MKRLLYFPLIFNLLLILSFYFTCCFGSAVFNGIQKDNYKEIVNAFSKREYTAEEEEEEESTIISKTILIGDVPYNGFDFFPSSFPYN